jgi:hypothetical protein
MKIRVNSVDYSPPELEGRTPFNAELLRMIPGSDRPDDWLAALATPIRWLEQGQEVEVTHIVVSARWQGTQIAPGMKCLPVGIAYVLDSSVLNDSSLDFKKCAYVAIGVAEQV